MDKIVIKGGNKLTGEVKVEGAKNAVLPILTASLLASDKPSKLVNVPALSDVETINNVLTTLNADVTYKKDENAVVVDATKTLNEEAPYEYVSKMRASILVMGPLLAETQDMLLLHCLVVVQLEVDRLSNTLKVLKL
ncbi:hypothetical protein UM550_08695 [Staphylococcus aureus]|nr:hypothetical protein UM550_08695 [Staphylococcus aureus]